MGTPQRHAFHQPSDCLGDGNQQQVDPSKIEPPPVEACVHTRGGHSAAQPGQFPEIYFLGI